MSKKNLDIIEIGNRLKEVRKKLGFTLQEMMDISGYSTTTLSEIERNINNPNPRYLLLLNEKFNVNLNWVFTGKGAMFNPDFEFTWDYGKDSKKILKMMNLIENCDIVRYAMLSHFIDFMNANKEKIKESLSDQEKE